MIAGLDLSLSCTGVCVAGVCDTITTRRRGMGRLHDIVCAVLQTVETADLVVIEGYAMGTARQAGTYAIGELGGVVRYALWQRDITYVDIPPAVLKKFATGKGNANKDTMVATAARLGCPANDNNACDSWWLYQMGSYPNLGATVPTTAYRHEAVTKVAWPAWRAAA